MKNEYIASCNLEVCKGVGDNVSSNDGVVKVRGYANKMTDAVGILHPDRVGDIVIATGVDLTNFNNNPIMLFQHDKEHPIGKVTTVDLRSDGIFIEGEVYQKLNERVYNAVDLGVLKTFSIGFRGLEAEWKEELDAYVFRRIELYEVSVVSVPAEPNAVFETVKSLDGDRVVLTTKEFDNSHITPKGDESMTKEELAAFAVELKASILEEVKTTLKSEENIVIEDGDVTPPSVEEGTPAVEGESDAVANGDVSGTEVPMEHEEKQISFAAAKSIVLDSVSNEDNFNELLKLHEELGTQLNAMLVKALA